ncbi:MAG: SHOCT domain-containing protein [Halovenus sp.]
MDVTGRPTDSREPDRKMNHDRHPDPQAASVLAAITAGTLGLAFSLMALGVEDFWVVFVVGFGGVLPVSMALLARARKRADSTSSGTPERGEAERALAELRKRYARGEFTDEEFERRVEKLLETTTVGGTRTDTERPDRRS